MIAGYDAALLHAIDAGRLPHAVLLVGDEYVCKKAVRFACCRLLCMSENEIDRYPDISYLDGQKMTAEAGGTVDMMIGEQTTAPFGKKRIFHIRNAGYMSVIVQNKLLKTIEEPTPDNVFFLSGMVDFLLPTILSRCTRLPLPLPTHDEAANLIVENAAQKGEAVDAELAKSCAVLTEYDIFEATELAIGSEYSSFYDAAVAYICLMKRKSLVSGDIEQFTKTRETALLALRIFARSVSDMLHVKLGVPMTVFCKSKFEQDIRLCAEKLRESSVLAVSALIGEAYSDIFANSSAKQVLTHLAARIEQEI